MNEVIVKIDSTAKPGLIAPARSGDYTGILPSQKIQEMLNSGEIKTVMNLDHDQVQPASIDLRLGDYAYPVDTSFLPGKGMTSESIFAKVLFLKRGAYMLFLFWNPLV